MLKSNKCDHCGESFENKDEVTVIINKVEVDTKRKDGKIHLKLSKNSLENRSISIFCEKCLDINLYR